MVCPTCSTTIPDDADSCPACGRDAGRVTDLVVEAWRRMARRRTPRIVRRAKRVWSVMPVICLVLLTEGAVGLGWWGWHTLESWHAAGARLRVGLHQDAGATSRGQTWNDGSPGPFDILPSAVVVLKSGGVLIGDKRSHVVWLANPGHRPISLYGRHVAPDAAVVVAGGGEMTSFAERPDARGDGGPATHAVIGEPISLAVDGHDNLYIVDPDGQSIREVDSVTGHIMTVVSN